MSAAERQEVIAELTQLIARHDALFAEQKNLEATLLAEGFDTQEFDALFVGGDIAATLLAEVAA